MKLIGTGIDLVETSRIAGSIERHGDRFLMRIFTETERQYCGSMKTPGLYYAARFAAKEAISKAFGTGIGAQLGWLDMEIRRRASGEPFVVIQGPGAATARRLGIDEVRLSMSHTEHYAVAHAFALGAD